MTDPATVFSRLGGRRGLIDGGVPPLLFAVANAGAAALGHADRALASAVILAGASALALGTLRRVQGASLAGVLRGLLMTVTAAAFALWTGRARDFFLPGMYVDAVWAMGLALSALIGHPFVGHAYAALFQAGGAWRDDPRLRRVLAAATWGLSGTYALRVGVQAALYRADEPALLALAKLALGWPLSAVVVVLTLRAVRSARRAGAAGRERATVARQ